MPQMGGKLFFGLDRMIIARFRLVATVLYHGYKKKYMMACLPCGLPVVRCATEIWDALKLATESDTQMAQAIVDSTGIILESNSLAVCYDERGGLGMKSPACPCLAALQFQAGHTSGSSLLEKVAAKCTVLEFTAHCQVYCPHVHCSQAYCPQVCCPQMHGCQLCCSQVCTVIWLHCLAVQAPSMSSPTTC